MKNSLNQKREEMLDLAKSRDAGGTVWGCLDRLHYVKPGEIASQETFLMERITGGPRTRDGAPVREFTVIGIYEN